MKTHEIKMTDREVVIVMDGLRGYIHSNYHPEYEKSVARAILLKLYDIYHRKDNNETEGLRN